MGNSVACVVAIASFPIGGDKNHYTHQLLDDANQGDTCGDQSSRPSPQSTHPRHSTISFKFVQSAGNPNSVDTLCHTHADIAHKGVRACAYIDGVVPVVYALTRLILRREADLVVLACGPDHHKGGQLVREINNAVELDFGDSLLPAPMGSART